VAGGTRKPPKWLPKVDFSAHPAALALGWLLAGLLIGLGDQAGLRGARSLGLALALAAALFARPHRLRWLALLALGGAASVRLHMAAPWRTYPERLPRRVCRVWLRGVAVTPASPGEAHSRIELRVRSMRTWAEDSWLPCRGTVLVELPRDTATPSYGELLEIAGAIGPISEHPDDALFNYARYLWKRGIVDRVRAETVVTTGHDRWRWPLAAAYGSRAYLAKALARGIPDPEDQAVLQAMALGYRQRLPTETRERFLKSSAIHVFAISGLHVGIVAMLCGWALVLFGVPFRLRSLLLIPVVGAYVFMCGAHASAVRAWLMLSCWWGSQMLQRPRVPLNTVAVAALLALLWRPLALLETGFLFSFVVVTVLIVGWPLVSDLARTLGERCWWLPTSVGRRSTERWRRLPTRSLAVSCLAWTGSAGMVAFSNGLLVPASIVLNLGVVLLCTALLSVATAKIAVSILGWRLLERTSAWTLGALSQCLRALTEGADLPGASFRICPLPAWLAIIYYGLLLAALGRQRRQGWRIALLGASALALLAPTLRQQLTWPEDQVLAGDGGTVPAALLVRPRGVPPILLNTGGSASSRRVRTILERSGTRELEAMVFSAGHRDACAGSAPILARWPVRTLVVPANYRRSRVLDRLVQQQQAQGRRVRILAGGARAVRLGRRRLQFVGKGNAQRFRLFLTPAPAGRAGLELGTTPLGAVFVDLPGQPGDERWTAPRTSEPVRLRVRPDRQPQGHAEGGLRLLSPPP